MFESFGLSLVPDPNLDDGRRFVQVRFPRSKRKRIQKKWSRRRNNFGWKQVAQPQVFRVGSVILMHPRAIAWVKTQSET